MVARRRDVDKERVTKAWMERMPERSALVWYGLGARVILDGKLYAEWDDDADDWRVVSEEANDDMEART